MPIDITDDFIRIRVKDPDLFRDDTFRTVWLSESKGIKSVQGKLKENQGEDHDPMVIQSLLFDKDKWSKEEAVQWARDHGYIKAETIFETKEKIMNTKFLTGAHLKIADEEKRIIEGYASTKDIDRMEEIILPKAFERSLPEFMKNAQMFYGHQTGGWNGLGKPIGKWLESKIDERGLWVRGKISKATQEAEEVWTLIKEDILKALSVGFIPKKSEYDEDTKIRTWTDLDLLEISVVPIPANPKALIEQAKAKNLEIKTITPEKEETKMGLELKKPETFEELSTQMLEMQKEFTALKEKQGRTNEPLLPEEKLKLEKMEKDFRELSEKFYAEKNKNLDRKLPVDQIDKGIIGLTYKQMIYMDAKAPVTDYHRKANRGQQLNDAIYVADALLREKANKDKTFRYGGPEKLSFWSEYRSIVEDLTGKAFDTATSGEGSQWIPTEFSTQFMDTLYQHFPLWNYFQSFAQPTATYNFPIFSTDTEAKLIAETTAIQTTIGDTNEETPATAVAAFVAKKLRATIIWSGEIQEDVSFDLIGEIQRKIVKEIYMATEVAMISGDDTTTHFDTGATPAATDARKAYKGLRRLGLTNSFVDNANAALSWTLITTALNKMGTTGLNPSDNGIIFPMGLYYKALGLTEVKTMDVFGPFATIVSGVLSKIGGMDVVASGMYRQDLNGAGIFDNVTTTQTSFIIVNKPAWRMGIVRDLGIEVERIAGWDQFKIYGWHRHSFGPIAAYVASAEPLVYSYDIAP